MNILFILSDQHNAKYLSCAGHDTVKTPNLDRLASEGVYFKNAITQSPVCTPSRMCFLSGQHPHNHGYYGLGGHKPHSLPSIFGYLKQHGYKTAAIGKIHLPHNWIEEDCDDFTEVYSGLSADPYCEYSDYLEKKGLSHLRDDGVLPEFAGHPQHGDSRASSLDYEDCVEAWIARRSINFMEKCKLSGKPFFAHVSLPRPHTAYTPSEPYWSMYNDKIKLPPNFDYNMDNKSPALKRQKEVESNLKQVFLLEPKTYLGCSMRKLQGYTGAVSMMDAAVGKIIEYLDESGLSDDTLVIYSSDHGDFACEHGLLEKAPGISSDAITRIPMIFRYPKQISAGLRPEGVIESVDVIPTALSLAGLPRMMTVDGIDYSDVLKGEKDKIKDIGVTQFALSKSIRKGDFRLVYYHDDLFKTTYPQGFGELYNIKEDPWEMNNLYFCPEYKEKVLEMQKDLFNYLLKTSRVATTAGAVVPDNDQAIETNGGQKMFADGKLGLEFIEDSIEKDWSRNYL